MKIVLKKERVKNVIENDLTNSAAIRILRHAGMYLIITRGGMFTHQVALAFDDVNAAAIKILDDAAIKVKGIK